MVKQNSGVMVAGAADSETQAVNEVRLVGRVSQDPERRELPSGDVLWTFRLVVARPADHVGPSVDTIDCAAWTGRAQRSVSAWHAGDVVEVNGSVRRRFFRGGAGAASRTEVEVGRGRVIRRAATG